MRTIVFSLLALAAILLMPAAALAETYCMARLLTGAWGDGWAPAAATAKKMALVACAANTPRSSVCVITSCVVR
jgi:hypothetical protein